MFPAVPNFHDRIFDEDGSGSVDFREFVMSLWNYCTLSKAALIMFAFDLYDNDNSGEIDLTEVELLLKEVYGREFQSNTQAQTIMAKLRGGDLGMDRNINVDQFREFCRTHPAVLYPAFVLQTQMQEKILGSKFWNSCSNARVKLSSGAYIDIAAILQAHVNEKVSYRNFESTLWRSRSTFVACFHATHLIPLTNSNFWPYFLRYTGLCRRATATARYNFLVAF